MSQAAIGKCPGDGAGEFPINILPMAKSSATEVEKPLWSAVIHPRLNQEEYRRAEDRLEEALTIFAEREAQFSAVMRAMRANVARVRDEVDILRTQRMALDASLAPPRS